MLATNMKYLMTLKVLFLYVCLTNIIVGAETKVITNEDILTNDEIQQLHSPYTGMCIMYFDDNKTIRYQSWFENGKAHGLSEVYNAKGTIQERISRFEGKLHGPWIHYRDNGMIISVAYFDNGKRIGKQITYNDITGSIRFNLEPNK